VIEKGETHMAGTLQEFKKNAIQEIQSLIERREAVLAGLRKAPINDDNTASIELLEAQILSLRDDLKIYE
jgi:hypothetical protein